MSRLGRQGDDGEREEDNQASRAATRLRLVLEELGGHV